MEYITITDWTLVGYFRLGKVYIEPSWNPQLNRKLLDGFKPRQRRRNNLQSFRPQFNPGPRMSPQRMLYDPRSQPIHPYLMSQESIIQSQYERMRVPQAGMPRQRPPRPFPTVRQWTPAPPHRGAPRPAPWHGYPQQPIQQHMPRYGGQSPMMPVLSPLMPHNEAYYPQQMNNNHNNL